jgi:hypothetical protein
MLDICDVIELEVVLNEPEIELELDFEGEYISGSDGQDYKRGYEEGHAQGLIDGRADGYEDGLKDGAKEEQEKSVTIRENGITEIFPDVNKVLSKVTAKVDVKSNGLPYDMGEFVLDADVQNQFRVNHSLGEVPEVVVVWTDDFADLSEENLSPYSTPTNLGFIWLRGLTGLPQKFTSAVTNENGIYTAGYLNKGEYRASYYTPTSTAYTPSLPTENQISIPRFSNNYYWRAGIKYKYFVAKAWWNNGGAVNVE